jgi:hypothetical protein
MSESEIIKRKELLVNMKLESSRAIQKNCIFLKFCFLASVIKLPYRFIYARQKFPLRTWVFNPFKETLYSI